MSVIIRLQNLPLSANAANIRTFFQGLKIPDGGVNIVGGEDGDAFIAFATDDDARKAMLLNNQQINGANIRLLLSSKQEMQTIITEAQNRVLKRSAPQHPNNTPQTQAEKRSYTFYNPNLKSQPDSYDSSSSNKMRIIDYSSSADSEPPRPSEFSYKSSRPAPQSDVHLPKNDKIVYNYESYDYNYKNSYENYPPHHFENNESYDYSYSNNNYDEPPIYDKYRETNEFFETMDHNIYRKSLLPTPVVDNNKKQLGQSLNRYHDYTNRPPWLEESMIISQSSAVRVTLPFSMISETTILDIFRKLIIVPKRGIKIEIDIERRFTGYVYVLFTNGQEAVKAIKLNNKPFRGSTLCIEGINESDFGKIVESPENSGLQMELPFNQRSLYYRDMCLEIINVSLEVNEKDVKDFLNVSMENKRIHFIEKEKHNCCLISAVDERMMLKILSFNGAIFRFNSIKVIAISKIQLTSYLAAGKREAKRESSTPNPLLAARKYLATSSKNDYSCVKFENLKKDMSVHDLSQLFSSTIIPLHNIIINNSEAIVDFISAATCQKIISDLKLRSNIDYQVTGITSGEFQKLKSKFLSNSNGRKSVTGNINKAPSHTSKSATKNQDKSQVKIRNLPSTVGNPQIKDFIRDFESQPLSIQICYANGRHTGEAILTFKNGLEAVKFKDEYHGKTFLQRELEVLLTDRN